MNLEIENIALFDMDGTLCDYEKNLIKDLNKLKSPQEPLCTSIPNDDAPDYLKNRSNLIRSSIEWWASLPKFKLGFDIWKIADDLGFRKMVLTQGPKRNPNAWSGKKLWIDKNLGTEIDVTITRDKGLVYGKVLVDDWPDYWLKWRPRGIVIMPASQQNEKFKHKQVTRYDGTNIDEVLNSMKKALDR
jgi:hypothetical protein